MQRDRGSDGGWGPQTIPLPFTSGLFKCLSNRISGFILWFWLRKKEVDEWGQSDFTMISLQSGHIHQVTFLSKYNCLMTLLSINFSSTSRYTAHAIYCFSLFGKTQDNWPASHIKGGQFFPLQRISPFKEQKERSNSVTRCHDSYPLSIGHLGTCQAERAQVTLSDHHCVPGAPHLDSFVLSFSLSLGYL